jgi:RNA polymerase sigma-70 factor (ECF subfamily)
MFGSKQASFEAMARALAPDLYRFAFWLCRDRPETVEADETVASLALEQVVAAVEMRDALGKLPQGYREPLLLQVLFGFGAAEIAEATASTEGAVLTRLSRARQALRRLLDPTPTAKPKVMP